MSDLDDPLSGPKTESVGIATPLRDATEAGRAAAASGGNAVDAALAAAAVLTVSYPHNCGLGGDLLALVREPDGTKTFVNASGRSPAAVAVDEVRRHHDQMPLTGPDTVTVPGVVSGWAALHARGAALPWSSALQPAVIAASDGVPISLGLANCLTEDWTDYEQSQGLRDVFGSNGSPLRMGDHLRQPALARTLQHLATDGPTALYGGSTGEQLVEGLRSQGVPMTVDDLRSHQVTEELPLQLEVDGWTVDVAGPNSQGFVLLRLLGALDQAVRGSIPSLMERVPALAVGRAFFETAAERDRVLADPESMTVDVRDLLTEAELAALLSMVSGRRHNSNRASKARPDGDTVAVVAADTSGRSVSLIQSLYYSFGSQILEPTTGIVLHNRGACFTLDPGSLNVLAPGKRPAHTLLPTLAERGDERLAVGTMGGEVQPQILLQVLSHLFAGRSCRDAVSSPRWTVGAWDRDEPTDTLNYEANLGSDVRKQFADWAGPLNGLPRGSGRVGHAQAVRIRGEDVTSGTDPRADG